MAFGWHFRIFVVTKMLAKAMSGMRYEYVWLFEAMINRALRT
jgi:hypothetical protein